MPRKRKGSGFFTVKTGRYHKDKGGAGRGHVGRRPSSRSSETLVGELSDDSLKSPTPTPSVSSLDGSWSCTESDATDDRETFRNALSPSSFAGSPNILNVEDISSTCMFEDIIKETHKLISAILPKHWIALRAPESFNIVQLSRGSDPAIQRNVNVNFLGVIRITVHRQIISEHLLKKCLENHDTDIPVNQENFRAFVDRVLSVVLVLRSFEICAGVDNPKYEKLWHIETGGAPDLNPYDESRYRKTFRSSGCALIIPIERWKCDQCLDLSNKLRMKLRSHSNDEAHPKTRNTFLDKVQVNTKLKSQSRRIKNANRKIQHLEKRVENLIKTNGVNIESDLADDLTGVLRDSDLTPIQSLFIQQQVKASKVKGKSGMRWHPTMIRLALLIKSTSTAAFEAIQNSGVIRFPSSRTLFDYSHAVKRSVGLFGDRIACAGNIVSKHGDGHQHFHNVLMDEIHCSQKLVYRKSDSSLIGYEDINEVEMELQQLASNVEDPAFKAEPAVASKILTYMVKGATNSIKEVIAAYPVSALTKEQLFDRTWEVIRACENVGVKILTIVCDGCAVNRSFFAMHTPASATPSNVVFCTVNMCAPDRLIYFISDPPHLLKTIRNCVAKSGTGQRCTRLLKKGGECIVWKVVERLFLEDMKSTLRRCYKLNSSNVYLNSYTCMKVSYAAQVLSKTVATDLLDRGWPGTKVQADFFLRVNNFFDCVNGAHSDQGRRTANDRLAPYTTLDDPRFQELMDFQQYLLDWEEEVNALEGISNSEKCKMLLSRQTLDGLYITINSFIGATKFLISAGAKFVYARVSNQDPVEQYFSKQRGLIGSRHNPTVDSFLSTSTKIDIHRDTNVRRRSANTEGVIQAMEISEEPLPKRKRK